MCLKQQRLLTVDIFDEIVTNFFKNPLKKEPSTVDQKNRLSLNNGSDQVERNSADGR